MSVIIIASKTSPYTTVILPHDRRESRNWDEAGYMHIHIWYVCTYKAMKYYFLILLNKRVSNQG